MEDMSYAFHRDVVLLQSPIWDCILSFTVLQLCIKQKNCRAAVLPFPKGHCKAAVLPSPKGLHYIPPNIFPHKLSTSQVGGIGRKNSPIYKYK